MKEPRVEVVGFARSTYVLIVVTESDLRLCDLPRLPMAC